MFNSIFNNQEAKLNIHQVKNKTRKELNKSCDISKIKY